MKKEKAVGNPYQTLVVWKNTIVGAKFALEFAKDFLKRGFRVVYAEEYRTLPDIEDGIKVQGTGGRNDLLFYVHAEDIEEFSVWLLQWCGEMSWFEDVMRYDGHTVPNRIVGLYTSSTVDYRISPNPIHFPFKRY